jgi:hypothetical protein
MIGVLGFDSRRGLRIFLFTTASRTGVGPIQPAIQRVPGTLSPGDKAEHSSPSSVQVINSWSYTSTPQYAFMVWCLVKYRDKFTFFLRRAVEQNTVDTSKSRDSSVGITTGYGQDDRGYRARLPAGTGNFSLHHRVQNGSGAHPASYTMGTGNPFPGGKAARA